MKKESITTALKGVSNLLQLRALNKTIHVAKNNEYGEIRIVSNSSSDTYTNEALPLFEVVLRFTETAYFLKTSIDSMRNYNVEGQTTLVKEFSAEADIFQIKTELAEQFKTLFQTNKTAVNSMLKGLKHKESNLPHLLRAFQLGFDSEEAFTLQILGGATYPFFDASMSAFESKPVNLENYTKEQIQSSPDRFVVTGSFGTFKDAIEHNANTFCHAVAYLDEEKGYIFNASRTYTGEIPENSIYTAKSIDTIYTNVLHELGVLKTKQEALSKMPDFIIPKIVGEYLQGVYLDIRVGVPQRTDERTQVQIIISPEYAPEYSHLYFEIRYTVQENKSKDYTVQVGLFTYGKELLYRTSCDVVNKSRTNRRTKDDFETFVEEANKQMDEVLVASGRYPLTAYKEDGNPIQRTGMLYQVMEELSKCKVGVQFESYCRTISEQDVILIYASALDYEDKAVGAKKVTYWVYLNKNNHYEVLYVGQDLRGTDPEIMAQQAEKVTFKTQFEVCTFLQKPIQYWSSQLY